MPLYTGSILGPLARSFIPLQTQFYKSGWKVIKWKRTDVFNLIEKCFLRIDFIKKMVLVSGRKKKGKLIKFRFLSYMDPCDEKCTTTKDMINR